jgi:IS4 transposase
MAKANARGMFVVSEFRRSSTWRINKNRVDQIIKIAKPRLGINNIIDDEYESLPEFVEVRIIKIRCAPKGFRPKEKWIITTHLDANKVPADDLCRLYADRWQVELNFRSIKTVLGMDFVAAKTPSSVEKEIWVHAITYNLIRIKMAQAAQVKKLLPQRLSFRAAQQTLLIVRQSLFLSQDDINIDEVLINLIAFNIIGIVMGIWATVLVVMWQNKK